MLNKNLFSLLLMLMMGALAGTGCGIVGDDDDSAGDDDDSAVGDDDDSAPDPLVMDLSYIDVFCQAESTSTTTRDTLGQYFLTVEFEGYAENVQLFMWDANTFEGSHFQDEGQPWELGNIDFSDPVTEPAQWDIYGFGGDDVDGEALPALFIEESIADANAVAAPDYGTILDCYDGNDVPFVDQHNYMVCATDFNDETNAQCYFCGEDLGDDVYLMGAHADNNDYQVGLWTDPNDNTVYEVTVDVTTDGSCTFDSELL